MDSALRAARKAVRATRSDWVPDPRVEVFHTRTRAKAGRIVIDGATTLPGATRALADRLSQLGLETDLRLRTLPDPSLAPRSQALVRAPIAPVYRRPTMNSTQLTQFVMGSRLILLSGRRRFWRVRGEDRHVGWVHDGYLERGEADWALAWERSEGGEAAVSLGAELVDEDNRTFARLPWGARVTRPAPGRVLLPDGRSGRVGQGDLVPLHRLRDRFPPRGESMSRTARLWLGAPYLWGGVTVHGVDCSGFVQSVYWMHGVALPRDSDMQARVGVEVDPGQEWTRLRPGDLLFFAERGRVNHVAMSLGGRTVIHASASNGAVEENDLTGDREVEALLLSTFVGARRLLPDRP